MTTTVILGLLVFWVIFHLADTADSDYSVKGLNFTQITTTSATVTWSRPGSTDNVTGFQITYKTASVEMSDAIDDVTVISYDLTNLEHYTTYRTCIYTLLDDGSEVIGDSSCDNFVTKYDPLNYYAIAAIAVVGFIMVVLLFSVIAQSRLEAKERAQKEKINPTKDDKDALVSNDI
ncbi:uncharacterized protein LOC100370251 [Saccoglossus kowalevskii]|uniref:Uncharacterized protein LOC100370251 n=1 Tax=Saccoglossus kowalevskii TaxID=10224 RepID=A0ABM0GN30_SACKO|nr:PREDICTED: uncharacterized protein LOC100370251 [Saccoglossus kowalevskii]